ncbi:MAG: ribbon-helix-helix protein, CopG family [Proteobacteria bacterium]|nr:ribbon-helix-helix protein, CopG family [Pseudomonadota bacterium]
MVHYTPQHVGGRLSAIRNNLLKMARLSISLEGRVYAALRTAANKRDVSMAWIARRAIAEYLQRQEPESEPELPLPQLPEQR